MESFVKVQEVSLKFIPIFVLITNIILGTAPCQSTIAVEYNPGLTLEQCIAYELSRLQETTQDPQLLAEAHIDLGESYLLNGQHELALQHLLEGYAISNHSIEKNDILLTRALFDQAITYAHLDLIDDFYLTVSAIQTDSNNNFSENWTLDLNQLPSPEEDMNFQQECLDQVKGAAHLVIQLVSSVKRPVIKFILYKIISDLEDRSKECCLSGGVWNACIQPLINKWYQSNEK